MIKAVYIIFIRDDDSILMHKRTRGYGAGCYSPPGGHIEPEDADAIACVIRETAEELGTDVRISRDDIELYHTQLRLSSDSDVLRTNYYYAVRKWDGTPTIGEPDKAEDLGWYRLSALPHPHMTGDVVKAFTQKRAGHAVSTDGFPENDPRAQVWLDSQTNPAAITCISP